MKYSLTACLCLFLIGVTAQIPIAVAQSPSSEGKALVLTVDDAIGPATRDYLVRGIEQAEQEQAALVIIRLNTPGGLDASMRDIIRKILAADVPVVTWVAPAGSRAASAGTYMLYASHIAAMAPATNLGAATPVQIGGGGADQNEPATPAERLQDALESAEETDKGDSSESSEKETAASPEDNASDSAAPSDETMPAGDASSRKAINDAVAYIRGLAERHGRNADWAERAVREAVSLTSSQALENNVIDVIAASLPELLDRIDGRIVQMDSGERELQTQDLETLEIEPDWRSRLLSVITNPTLAYILLMVGVYGLILEGYNPGALVPGVIGGICLLLALYAFQILPVNYAGLALMALGLALIAVELFIPSFGILGIGGVVAMVFGSIILFDEDVVGVDVNHGLIGGMGLFSALLFAAIVYLAMRVLRKPRPGSTEALIGEHAEAISDFDPSAGGHGRVHLLGEDWQALATQPIRRGDQVEITAMQREGLVLEVRPVHGESRASATI